MPWAWWLTPRRGPQWYLTCTNSEASLLTQARCEQLESVLAVFRTIVGSNELWWCGLINVFQKLWPFIRSSNQTHVPELEALAVLPFQSLSFYMFEYNRFGSASVTQPDSCNLSFGTLTKVMSQS